MADKQPAADSPSKFCVFIKTLGAESFAAPVSPDDGVRELKATLSAQDSSLTPKTRMLFSNSGRTEGSKQITPNCFLYHTLKWKCSG